MVYMKKGATPSKNQQQFKKGKKAVQVKPEEEDNDFDDMDDSDDDIDSDEAPQLQRTPASKGIKARQSLSEKKVSFSIPGKNSPAGKTPKKDNSILSKKQPTPANKGRTSMQEFKGMKVQVKEDDDDDEDSDDDDFEIDEDMDDDDDLDLDVAEGDDDAEDDDDEEEDDDEDDDEEGEDDTIQEKLSLLKQNNGQNKQKTPVKGNEKAKNAESPAKGQTPKKEQSEKASPKPAKVQQQVTDEVERRRLRDSKMIYVGGLPNDATPDELKSLSKDIVDVSLPLGNRKNKAKSVFAFITFNSEAKAESNYTTLQSKKFRGQPLTLDFVGHKSKNKKIAEDINLRLNLKKLFVSGVPVETTIDQVAKYFKTAFQITFNQSPMFRTVIINFDSEEAAKAAYDANKEITLSGHKLTVLFSRQGGQSEAKKRFRKNKNKKGQNNNLTHGENPAKKMKFSKQKRESEE